MSYAHIPYDSELFEGYLFFSGYTQCRTGKVIFFSIENTLSTRKFPGLKGRAIFSLQCNKNEK